ncbi:SCO family protein [Novosphingobium sp. M1R2S20]|uniref:SCO family protein n=1 Tax=Novosphingobium rhizovicinum TaxID=3228928 RepID=A0ABV3RCK2_9SPHN
MNRRAMTHHFRLLPVLLASLALAACGSQDAGQPAADRPPLEGAAIGGPFSLVDKDGKTVSWDVFKGKYRIVYFGYTFCPDACPMDMQALMKGFAQFEQSDPQLAAKVQPIFITIDPERDTPEAVGQWTSAFSPRLVGLTGTPEQIAAVEKAFAAYSAKGEETSGGYLMDHSRIAYLMGPEGEPLAMLPVDKGGDAVAAELGKWVK